MVDMLRERDAGHVKVFAGGGGTITPEEIRELEAYGVERIYHPNDGMKMGLVEMIQDVVSRAGNGRAKWCQGQFPVSNKAASGVGEIVPDTISMADEIAIGLSLIHI